MSPFATSLPPPRNNTGVQQHMSQQNGNMHHQSPIQHHHQLPAPTQLPSFQHFEAQQFSASASLPMQMSYQPVSQQEQHHSHHHAQQGLHFGSPLGNVKHEYHGSGSFVQELESSTPPLHPYSPEYALAPFPQPFSQQQHQSPSQQQMEGGHLIYPPYQSQHQQQHSQAQYPLPVGGYRAYSPYATAPNSHGNTPDRHEHPDMSMGSPLLHQQGPHHHHYHMPHPPHGMMDGPHDGRDLSPLPEGLVRYDPHTYKRGLMHHQFEDKEPAIAFVKEESLKYGFSVLVRTSKPDYVVVICNCGRRLKRLKGERKRNRRFKTAMTGCEWRVVLFRTSAKVWEFRATPKMTHNHGLPVIDHDPM
ncbi:hypothetical protein HKX48_000929 [Thoreauomyces humboldtii]|nr:hypothetical protein HKX48_000929 [Thoreauomyces humboldtii]